MFPSSQSDPTSGGPMTASAPGQSSPFIRNSTHPSPLIEQIMRSRMAAAQNNQLLSLGGPQYLDQIDQLRTNPMMSWF